MLKITDQEFMLLSTLIRDHYGIHIKREKETLLVGRLQKEMDKLGFINFTQYYDYLVSDHTGHAALTLVDKITTNHTFFMREAEHFEFLADRVLPELHKKIKNRDLKVWCAASSTGEEPYTLAMIIAEHFGAVNELWDTKLLATDISARVLETARKGIYEKDNIEPLPSKWKSGYFKMHGQHTVEIIDQLKNEVIFRKFNLMEPVFPFKSKFHVIFCRNVMIYFDAKTKDILLKKLYDALDTGGYLFVGQSESINRDAAPFKYIKPSIYQK